MTPRQRILADCDRRGRAAVVADCVALLAGADVDDGVVLMLGGDAAPHVLAGAEGGRGGYWPRVWALRGLLHAYLPEARAAVVGACADEAWRARELAAKVVARHAVADAFDAVATLRTDPVARVRAAAERALARLATDLS